MIFFSRLKKFICFVTVDGPVYFRWFFIGTGTVKVLVSSETGDTTLQGWYIYTYGKHNNNNNIKKYLRCTVRT